MPKKAVSPAVGPAILIAAGLLSGCVDRDEASRVMAYSSADPTSVIPTYAKNRSQGEHAEAVPGGYVVEFRARTGLDIMGHSYLVFGTLGADGDIVDPVHTGLYPDDITGFAFAVGGTAATTDAVPFDRTIEPTSVYRRALTPTQHQRLSAAVERARNNPPLWSWTNYNCNTYLADLAREIDLATPTGGTWMAPTLFVAQLKELNE